MQRALSGELVRFSKSNLDAESEFLRKTYRTIAAIAHRSPSRSLEALGQLLKVLTNILSLQDMVRKT